MNTCKTSAEERLAAKQAKEQELIANIDKAIGMAPKLSHPPVFRDHELMIDFRKVTEMLALRQRCRVQAEIQYRKATHIASKRNLG